MCQSGAKLSTSGVELLAFKNLGTKLGGQAVPFADSQKDLANDLPTAQFGSPVSDRVIMFTKLRRAFDIEDAQDFTLQTEVTRQSCVSLLLRSTNYPPTLKYPHSQYFPLNDAAHALFIGIFGGFSVLFNFI